MQRQTGLAGALFTTTQQRVLALLFCQPSRSFRTGELIQLTGAGSGAVQRELKRLVPTASRSSWLCWVRMWCAPALVV